MKKLTLFNRTFEFFWGERQWEEQRPIKNFKKNLIRITLIYLLTMTALSLLWADGELNEGVFLNVYPSHATGTYKALQLPEGNSYVTGTSGELCWKPHNLGEAIILTAISNDGVSLLDVAGMMVIAGLILFMFKGSDDSAPFTKNVNMGFMLLIFAIALSETLIGMARVYLASQYIPYITHGQFKAHITFKAISYSYLIYPLLLALMRIPQKGLELQKQQELTV